jgi:hypothetical protein
MSGLSSNEKEQLREIYENFAGKTSYKTFKHNICMKYLDYLDEYTACYNDPGLTKPLKYKITVKELKQLEYIDDNYRLYAYRWYIEHFKVTLEYLAERGSEVFNRRRLINDNFYFIEDGKDLNFNLVIMHGKVVPLIQGCYYVY